MKNKINFLLYTSIFALSSALIYAHPGEDFSNKTNNQRAAPTSHFNVEVIEGWVRQPTQEEESGNILFMKEDGSTRAFFTVISGELEGSPSLERFFNENLSAFKTDTPDFKVLQTGDMKVGSYPAKWATYSYKTNEQSAMSKQIFFIAETRGYVVIETVVNGDFKKYEEEFNRILKTFQIRKK